ncbi:MAG: hypothetical protein N3I86_06605 [Verrucomicrobiae bacterium]|nr:hypothetical protein [Verrucomicrobiae bacterium]
MSTHRRSTPEILEALKARLTAATWQPPGGGPAEQAFEQVALYDLTDLESAFRDLLASKRRVAFLVPTGETFAEAARGRMALYTRRLTVSLLISDRVHGKRLEALYGSATTPGAEGLKELALTVVCGQLFEPPAGVLCKPLAAVPLQIEDNTRALPGRAAIELQLELTGGVVSAPVLPAPTL